MRRNSSKPLIKQQAFSHYLNPSPKDLIHLRANNGHFHLHIYPNNPLLQIVIPKISQIFTPSLFTQNPHFETIEKAPIRPPQGSRCLCIGSCFGLRFEPDPRGGSSAGVFVDQSNQVGSYLAPPFTAQAQDCRVIVVPCWVQHLHPRHAHFLRLLVKGYPQRTIFENLVDAGLSFGIYYQNIPAVLFYGNLRKLKYITKFHSYENVFKAHCRKGSLPNYAVIEQRYMDSKSKPATDDHPSHDVYQGQMFIKEVYESLRASPQWNQTLLIITYDEHGGFYDHVPTPIKGVPSPDGIIGPDPYYFAFDRLGVRVPTIMVSPWIEKGTVVHGPNGVPTSTSEFEHSSIPATVKKIFNLQAPFLTRRDAWAGTFEGIVQTRTEPRTDCPEQLPTPVQIRQGEAHEEAKLTEFQQELMQLASVLNGDHLLTNFTENVIKRMNVRDGINYMENAVKRFFEASFSAKKMGVDDERTVKMRPSLTSRFRSSSSAFNP